MTPVLRRIQFSRHAGLLTFLLTVVAAYASELPARASPLFGPDAPLLVLLGLAYLFIGLLALPRLDPGRNRGLILP